LIAQHSPASTCRHASAIYRSIIFELAATQKHPAIYPFRTFPEAGGLISYGIDILEQVRRCAPYVDQILKGARPGDLPVQAPTKFEMVINLKTAKALGLDVSPALLARADDVIEQGGAVIRRNADFGARPNRGCDLASGKMHNRHTPTSANERRAAVFFPP
jgi:hypothetical protein